MTPVTLRRKDPFQGALYQVKIEVSPSLESLYCHLHNFYPLKYSFPGSYGGVAGRFCALLSFSLFWVSRLPRVASGNVVNIPTPGAFHLNPGGAKRGTRASSAGHVCQAGDDPRVCSCR